MEVKISITKNDVQQEGLAFMGNNGEELYFIDYSKLNRIEINYKLLDQQFGDVLFQVVTVAKHDWATKELLHELTKIIHDRYPNTEDNIIADTFCALLQFQETNKVWKQFNIDNPFENYQGTKTEWKKQFWEYLKLQK